MHFLIVLCSVLAVVFGGLAIYLSIALRQMTKQLEETGLLKREADLFFTYNLAKQRPEQVGEAKVEKLRRAYEDTAEEAAIYHSFYWAMEWCKKLAFVSGLIAVVLILVERGVIR